LVFVLQVSFLNIENSLPGIETLDNESIKVLFEAKAKKDGREVCHPRVVAGESNTPEPLSLGCKVVKEIRGPSERSFERERSTPMRGYSH
jgi:hypothetical protein